MGYCLVVEVGCRVGMLVIVKERGVKTTLGTREVNSLFDKLKVGGLECLLVLLFIFKKIRQFDG